VKNKKSYWLISITSILLVSLLVNQVIYVIKAANEQEMAFNDKVEIALEVIVDKISEDNTISKSVGKCLNKGKNKYCSKVLNTEKVWESVDSTIQLELKRFAIELNYNFDFCKNQPYGPYGQNKSHTYTKKMDKVFQKKGIIMFLEFPEKSKYLFRQMGSVFISSVLLILFITIAFIITFKFYHREKRMAERIRDFLNNMTHEFKTPLANISFANNMIAKQSGIISPENVKKYTQIIQTENDRIIENCEDILEISRQENVSFETLSETVDVHETIHQIQDSFMSTNLNSDIVFELKLEANKYMVKGKYSFFFNTLSNIIDNAIKYCGNTPEILISTTNNKETINISITDNGLGIHKNDIQSVFDNFYRVSTGDRHDVKGFGLGLSYVKMVIEQMKGEVTLKSEPGTGSTFTIKLPVSDV
jgi:two-component system phosphate regulon sensor histidine kinase PhoR